VRIPDLEHNLLSLNIAQRREFLAGKVMLAVPARGMRR